MSPNGPALDPCIGCCDLESGPRCIGPDGRRDYHALAAAYLKSPVADKNAPAIPHRDAFDCVFSMTSESAEDALAFIFVALEHAVTEKQEAYLAAGALEQLLKRHGVLVIDRVLAAARRDPKFRRCLAGSMGTFGHGQIGSRADRRNPSPAQNSSEATAKEQQAFETSLKSANLRRCRILVSGYFRSLQVAAVA